jgi:hypothetical protein
MPFLPRFLAANVQPHRLTEPHRGADNPRFGFELMKKRPLLLCRIGAGCGAMLAHR